MQENTKQIHANSFDEISVKKFIREILSIVLYLLKKWYWIVLGVALLGGVRYYQISQIKPTYPAKIKLFIRPQKIAKENKLLLQTYVQLMHSRTLLEELFLEKIDSNGEEELLINKYLATYYEYKPNEIDSDIPRGFLIEGDSLSKLNIDELSVFNKVMDKVSTPFADYSDGFVDISADYDLGLVVINVSTPTTELSLLLLDRLCSKVKRLLPELNDYPHEKAFSKLSSQADSLSQGYKQTYYQLNLYRDKRGRIIQDSSRINEVKSLEKKIHRLEADAEVYKLEYLASLEQLKVSQVDVGQNTLLIREVERTLPPIKAYQPSSLVEGVKWGVLGGILSIVLMVFLRIFRNLYQELK